MGLFARWRQWLQNKLNGWAWERVGRQIGEQKRAEALLDSAEFKNGGDRSHGSVF